MKEKNIPLRTCIVTKEKLPKKELIRVVRTPNGGIVIDEFGKTNGRGAYLKKDLQVFEKAKVTRILNKHLEMNIPNEIFEQLNNLIK